MSLLLLASGCVSPSTQIELVLDSDAPSDRAMNDVPQPSINIVGPTLNDHLGASVQ